MILCLGAQFGCEATASKYSFILGGLFFHSLVHTHSLAQSASPRLHREEDIPSSPCSLRETREHRLATVPLLQLAAPLRKELCLATADGVSEKGTVRVNGVITLTVPLRFLVFLFSYSLLEQESQQLGFCVGELVSQPTVVTE